MLGIVSAEWPHKSFKIRKANITICPRKLSSPSPPKPVEEQKVWPPPKWDPKFKEMIAQYSDILVDELSKDKTIFAPTEPTKLKKDAKPYKDKRARRSSLHYKEHTDKALKKLIREGVLKKAPPGAKFTYIPAQNIGSLKMKQKLHSG